MRDALVATRGSKEPDVLESPVPSPFLLPCPLGAPTGLPASARYRSCRPLASASSWTHNPSSSRGNWLWNGTFEIQAWAQRCRSGSLEAWMPPSPGAYGWRNHPQGWTSRETRRMLLLPRRKLRILLFRGGRSSLNASCSLTVAVITRSPFLMKPWLHLVFVHRWHTSARGRYPLSLHSQLLGGSGSGWMCH